MRPVKEILDSGKALDTTTSPIRKPIDCDYWQKLGQAEQAFLAQVHGELSGRLAPILLDKDAAKEAARSRYLARCRNAPPVTSRHPRYSLQDYVTSPFIDQEVWTMCKQELERRQKND